MYSLGEKKNYTKTLNLSQHVCRVGYLGLEQQFLFHCFFIVYFIIFFIDTSLYFFFHFLRIFWNICRSKFLYCVQIKGYELHNLFNFLLIKFIITIRWASPKPASTTWNCRTFPPWSADSRGSSRLRMLTSPTSLPKELTSLPEELTSLPMISRQQRKQQTEDVDIANLFVWMCNLFWHYLG